MTASTWEFADAWLMVAASDFGKKGCDLSELIGRADAYNHDIPPEAMVERSVGRLVASGLMSVSDGRFRLTEDGLVVARQAGGGMFERAPALLRLLANHPLVEGEWHLPPGSWRASFEQYRKAMSKWL